MCLGALVHAGVPLSYLAENLTKLGIAGEYHLWAERIHHQGLEATKVHVDLLDQADCSDSVSKTVIPHQHDEYDDFDHADYPHSHHSHPDHHNPPVELQSQQVISEEKTDFSLDQTAHASHSPHPSARGLTEIGILIRSAQLPPPVEQWSLAIFQNLAIAEGAVHGIEPEKVHFHEVGATDALVDIVGTCLGLDWLGIETLYCSALPTGGGTVWAAHGRLPVPTPAVLKLWEMHQVPVYSNGIDQELVTPTGAAIATTLAQGFGSPPPLVLKTIGLGAGTRSLPIPNILRLWIGEREEIRSSEFGVRNSETLRVGKACPLDKRSLGFGVGRTVDVGGDRSSRSETFTTNAVPNPVELVTLLQTQLDDLSPQVIGYVFEQLLEAGALDVFTQAIVMKKNRPGILLTVVCSLDRVAICEQILFRETTTLGIRRLTQARSVLQREIQTVEIPQGSVAVKVAWSGDGNSDHPLKVQPEYEDCAAIARKHNLPLQTVQRSVLQAWHQSQKSRFEVI